MPRLWSETIEAHRHAVREATLDATWALVLGHGLRSVTMSQIAEATGVGRATLYKYFPDVEAILIAWHQRQVAAHLTALTELSNGPGRPAERLEAVLQAYALIAQQREHHGPELGALLHRDGHGAGPQQQLVDLFRDLLLDVAATGELRDDVAPEELARYCLHALAAAGDLHSADAVRRLVSVTLTGLRPSRLIPTDTS